MPTNLTNKTKNTKSMTNNIEPYKNKQQIAEHFGVSTRTVDRWILSGCPVLRLGGSGLGRTPRFRLSDVSAWIDTQATVSAR